MQFGARIYVPMYVYEFLANPTINPPAYKHSVPSATSRAGCSAALGMRTAALSVEKLASKLPSSRCTDAEYTAAAGCN